MYHPCVVGPPATPLSALEGTVRSSTDDDGAPLLVGTLRRFIRARSSVREAKRPCSRPMDGFVEVPPREAKVWGLAELSGGTITGYLSGGRHDVADVARIDVWVWLRGHKQRPLFARICAAS